LVFIGRESGSAPRAARPGKTATVVYVVKKWLYLSYLLFSHSNTMQYMNKLLFSAGMLLGLQSGLFAQTNLVSSQIKVLVRFASVDNTADCDVIAGDSDFAWHFSATDNSLGYTNNAPTDTDFMGVFNLGYRNGHNGPYTISPNDGTADSGWDPANGQFFIHNYCADDVPTSMSIRWRAYENDAVGNYSTTNNPDGNTGVQTVPMAVPASAGVNIQTFTASGTSGSCSQTYNLSLSVERIDLLGVPPLNATICQGESFSWQGQGYTDGGTYTRMFTAQNGCDSTATLNLTVNPALVPGLSIASNVAGDTLCFGDVVIFTATPTLAGSQPTYQWFINGNNLGISDAAFGTTALNNGDIVSCTMSVDTFCVTDSTVQALPLTMTVQVCSGTESLANGSAPWTLFPNPAADRLFLAGSPSGDATLSLFAASGQLLRLIPITADLTEIDLNGIEPGFYLFQLTDQKGSFTQKIIVGSR